MAELVGKVDSAKRIENKTDSIKKKGCPNYKSN